MFFSLDSVLLSRRFCVSLSLNFIEKFKKFEAKEVLIPKMQQDEGAKTHHRPILSISQSLNQSLFNTYTVGSKALASFLQSIGTMGRPIKAKPCSKSSKLVWLVEGVKS